MEEFWNKINEDVAKVSSEKTVWGASKKYLEQFLKETYIEFLNESMKDFSKRSL